MFVYILGLDPLLIPRAHTVPGCHGLVPCLNPTDLPCLEATGLPGTCEWSTVTQGWRGASDQRIWAMRFRGARNVFSFKAKVKQ